MLDDPSSQTQHCNIWCSFDCEVTEVFVAETLKVVKSSRWKRSGSTPRFSGWGYQPFELL